MTFEKTKKACKGGGPEVFYLTIYFQRNFVFFSYYYARLEREREWRDAEKQRESRLAEKNRRSEKKML